MESELQPKTYSASDPRFADSNRSIVGKLRFEALGLPRGCARQDIITNFAAWNSCLKDRSSLPMVILFGICLLMFPLQIVFMRALIAVFCFRMSHNMSTRQIASRVKQHQSVPQPQEPVRKARGLLQRTTRGLQHLLIY